MDAALIGQGLLVYGPLGVLAAAGLHWKNQADLQHKKNVELFERVSAEHTAAIAKLSTEHRAEVRQLTDRFVALVETYAGHYRGLLDKVSSVIEALPRAAKR